MAETMKQYMIKTQADYGGIARPKIKDNDSFELKGAIPSKTTADAKVAIQEMVEYSQKWHNGTSRRRRPHYTKYFPLNEEGKTLEEAYYTQFGGPFQGGGCKAAALGFYQRNNANPSYQERIQSMEETLGNFMSKSAKRHGENSNMIKEIRSSMDATIRNQGASIKTLKIQIGRLNNYYCEEKKGSYGQKFLEANSYEASHIDNSIPRKEKDPGCFTLTCYINNVFFDNALTDLGASISFMPLSTYLSLGLGELAHTKLTAELADRTVKYSKRIAENVLVSIGKFAFPIYFIILDIPEDVKVPLILGRPFLSTAHAKIDVFKRKITLRVGDEKIIFKSMKPGSSLIKRVYMLGLREHIELDLEARLMGETLVLNRSLDLLYGDYIELNDLNVPLELRRDQVDDLMPTIEEGEVIDEPMIDIIKTRNNESFDEYPSFCDFGQKIHIDCAYNLRFSCMIVVENMDGYRDQDMGDIIFGEPFCKASCVEARRFDGLITIHNGNDYVTYQMARSHPRFKHLSNTQCNKIKPLLKDLAAKKSTMLMKDLQYGILAH
ncbi:retrovirus-related pol polyprotein from transposon TNT 1-94 [Tanacetum coccineum]